MSQTILKEIFRKRFLGNIVARFLSIIPIGKLIFSVSLTIKQILLLNGTWSQRVIEYPWVINQTKTFDKESLILDIGVSESLLSHELAFRGFKVIGLDIRDYPFKNKYIKFVKKNILNTKLPNNTFDVAIIVSTIEHIGLNSYQQLTANDDGDIKAMDEIHRIVKTRGIVIITTPYVGNESLKVNAFERHYNRTRLEKLIKNFHILKEEYYYPMYVGKRLYWKKMSRKNIDKKKFPYPGIACLVLSS